MTRSSAPILRVLMLCLMTCFCAMSTSVIASNNFDIPRFLENQTTDDARREIEDRTEDVVEIGGIIIIAVAVLVILIAVGLFTSGRRGPAIQIVTHAVIGLLALSLIGYIVRLGLQGQ